MKKRYIKYHDAAVYAICYKSFGVIYYNAGFKGECRLYILIP